MALLKKCCFVKLCIVVEFFACAGLVLAIIFTVLSYSKYSNVSEIFDKTNTVRNTPERHDDSRLAELREFIIAKGTQLTALIVSILYIIIQIMLIIGVRLMNNSLLLYWLVAHGIMMVAMQLPIIVFGGVADYFYSLQSSLIAYGLYLLILGLSFYFWLCVYSLYQSSSKDEGRTNFIEDNLDKNIPLDTLSEA